MRNAAFITLAVILAASAVASAETFQFSGSPVSKTDYLTTGRHLGIAGDGQWGSWYAVINADRTLSRYAGATHNADLTAAGAHSYVDVASAARADDYNDYYWGLYENGLDVVRITANTVTKCYEDTSETYTSVAGGIWLTNTVILARAAGGADVVSRSSGLLADDQLTGYNFLDLSEYGSWGNHYYGLTDTAVHRLEYAGGSLNIATTLATFASGTYISVAGDSRSNNVAILARADGGLDRLNGSTITTYYDSDTVFPFLGTYGGAESGNTFYAAIPEPTTLGLLGIGGLALLRRRSPKA